MIKKLAEIFKVGDYITIYLSTGGEVSGQIKELQDDYIVIFKEKEEVLLGERLIGGWKMKSDIIADNSSLSFV